MVQLKGKNNFKKIERLTKICKETAEQPYRNQVTFVHDVKNDLKVLQQDQSDINLICYENVAETLSIKQFLQQDFKTITVVIGHEGGINPNEIAVLSSYQYYPAGFH